MNNLELLQEVDDRIEQIKQDKTPEQIALIDNAVFYSKKLMQILLDNDKQGE